MSKYNNSASQKTTNKQTTLSPSQAEAISLFIQNAGKDTNTFELREHGVATVSPCISQLRAKGVIIEMKRKPAMDSSGKLHKRVAHYQLKGWC